MAEKLAGLRTKRPKKERLIELKRSLVSPSLKQETIILTMSRLGIPEERIAARLKINRKTAKKYSEKPRPIQSIKKSLNKGHTFHKVAVTHGCPEPLVWSVALEGKSDQERFKSLNWGLRTWDHWYFNDVDQRFGDDWTGVALSRICVLHLGESAGHSIWSIALRHGRKSSLSDGIRKGFYGPSTEARNLT